MKPKKKAASSAAKVRKHRARMRAQGLRQVHFWVPDVRSKEFAEQAHRESLAIANSPHEKDNLAFIDSIFEENLREGFYDK
jgi:hypothetical protein